jgi:hypothetical protein
LTNLPPSVSRLATQCATLKISQACKPPRPVTEIGISKARRIDQDIGSPRWFIYMHSVRIPDRLWKNFFSIFESVALHHKYVLRIFFGKRCRDHNLFSYSVMQVACMKELCRENWHRREWCTDWRITSKMPGRWTSSTDSMRGSSQIDFSK